MLRKPLWLIGLLLLAGCEGGIESKAVDTCTSGIAEKLGGKSFRLDPADMQAKAVADGDVVTITSTVVFDAGLPSESKQTFECKARFANGQGTVLSLNFIW